MSSRHLVSEMVSSVNVAINARFSTVFVKKSNLILELANVLYINGFIRGFSSHAYGIMLFLKYDNSKSIISSLKAISTPKKRIF